MDRPRTSTVGRARPDALAPVLRVAVEAEKELVRQLDDEIFPPDDNGLQRAPAGELETGVERGDVFLLERDGAVLGYVHLDRTNPQLVYLSGIGLRPDFQRQGLGTKMVDILLRDHSPEPTCPWVTVTSPLNHLMLRIILRRSFAGRWFVPDFFGPGRHRLVCQLMTSPVESRPVPDERISVMDFAGLERSLESGNVIREYGDPQGETFLLAPRQPGDFRQGRELLEMVLHPG